MVWINRFGRPADRLPGEPKGMIASLDQLAPLLAVYELWQGGYGRNQFVEKVNHVPRYGLT